MSKNLSSAAVMIGTLRVKTVFSEENYCPLIESGFPRFNSTHYCVTMIQCMYDWIPSFSSKIVCVNTNLVKI